LSGAQLLPVFLKLAGRKVLLVGAGPVAASKLPALLASRADVTVVAPEVRYEIAATSVRIERRAFRPDDLDGAWLVVAAAPPEVNLAVSQAADERHIFLNAVDDRSAASVYTGGVLRRGGLTIAVSTGGRAPALAGLLREAIEELIPEDVSNWVELASTLRREQQAAGLAMGARRPRLLEALNRRYAEKTVHA